MKLDDLDYDKIGVDLEINKGSITESFMNQAQLRNYYGLQAASARTAVEMAKLSFTIIESNVDQTVRKMAEDKNEKMTEGKVTSRVQMTQTWQDAKTEVIEAENVYRALSQAADSFDQRRDMLVQLSKHLLVEREGELRISVDDRLETGKAAANQALQPTKHAAG